MQVNLVESATPKFKPFTLEINVENPHDLISLWARFNMSGEVLDAAADARNNTKIKKIKMKGSWNDSFRKFVKEDPEGKRAVWEILNNKLEELGIERR